ncbi:hypothetical protein GW17_00057125 [Ensete ventricosum]|nr:hypothetical protein GW17_00057125 [Ensete ventricosum]
MMRLGTRLECVGSSPRVSGVCQDGAREFAGRRPRPTGRLSGVVEWLVRSWEVRTMRLGTRLKYVKSSPRVSGVCQDGIREFVRRRPRLVGRLSGDFTEGIGKIARNTSGDRRRRTVRLATWNAGSCRIVGVRLLSLVVMYGCNP